MPTLTHPTRQLNAPCCRRLFNPRFNERKVYRYTRDYVATTRRCFDFTASGSALVALSREMGAISDCRSLTHNLNG